MHRSAARCTGAPPAPAPAHPPHHSPHPTRTRTPPQLHPPIPHPSFQLKHCSLIKHYCTALLLVVFTAPFFIVDHKTFIRSLVKNCFPIATTLVFFIFIHTYIKTYNQLSNRYNTFSMPFLQNIDRIQSNAIIKVDIHFLDALKVAC